MGEIVRRGTREQPRFHLRYVEGYRPAVNADGTPELYTKGPKIGQPKVDDNGQPLMEPIRKQVVAKGAQTPADARRMLAEIERRLMDGKLGIEPPKVLTPQEQARATITVAQLGEKFGKEYNSPRLKDPDDYRMDARGILKSRIVPTLGKKLASSVTSLDVETLRDKLTADKYKPSSIISALATLSKMYTWARKQGLVSCANPASGVERPRAQSSIDFLSNAEAAKLLEHARQHAMMLWAMVAVGLYAGLRKGEILGLRWTDVHLDMARIDVLRSYTLLPKSGKPRHVPMHPELVLILRHWRDFGGARSADEDTSDDARNLVFPINGKMGRGDEDYGLPELLKAAKCHVPQKPWHALRHTFASHFMMSGGNIVTLQRLLGHSTITVTLIYAHLAPDFMAAEVARMSYEFLPADITPIGSRARR